MKYHLASRLPATELLFFDRLPERVERDALRFVDHFPADLLGPPPGLPDPLLESGDLEAEDELMQRLVLRAAERGPGLGLCAFCRVSASALRLWEFEGRP